MRPTSCKQTSRIFNTPRSRRDTITRPDRGTKRMKSSSLNSKTAEDRTRPVASEPPAPAVTSVGRDAVASIKPESSRGKGEVTQDASEPPAPAVTSAGRGTAASVKTERSGGSEVTQSQTPSAWQVSKQRQIEAAAAANDASPLTKFKPRVNPTATTRSAAQADPPTNRFFKAEWGNSGPRRTAFPPTGIATFPPEGARICRSDALTHFFGLGSDEDGFLQEENYPVNDNPSASPDGFPQETGYPDDEMPQRRPGAFPVFPMSFGEPDEEEFELPNDEIFWTATNEGSLATRNRDHEEGGPLQAVLVTVHEATVQQIEDDTYFGDGDKEESPRRPSALVVTIAVALVVIIILAVAIPVAGRGGDSARENGLISSTAPTMSALGPTLAPVAVIDGCFNSTDDIYAVVKNKLSSTSLDIILCPDTVFEIGFEDPETLLYVNGTSPLVLASNLAYKCGEDGALANNCTLRGGDVHVTSANKFVGEEHSNVIIQGLTFESKNGLVMSLFNGGDVTILDCVFQNIQTDGAILVEWTQEGDSVLTVAFVNVMFDSIKPFPRSTGSSLSGGVINAGGPENRLFFQCCAFRNNGVDTGLAETDWYAIRTAGAFVSISDTCFVDNDFDGFGAVLLFGGSEFESTNNYATSARSSCDYIAMSTLVDPARERFGVSGCRPAEESACGGTSVFDCGHETDIIFPPNPYDINFEEKFDCKGPASRLGLHFRGGTCTENVFCLEPALKSCTDFPDSTSSTIPATNSREPGYIIAYGGVSSELLFEGIVNEGGDYSISTEGGPLGANVIIEVYPPNGPRDDDTILQRVVFDATCQDSGLCFANFGPHIVFFFRDEEIGNMDCIVFIPVDTTLRMSVSIPSETRQRECPTVKYEVKDVNLITNFTFTGSGVLIRFPELVDEILDQDNPVIDFTADTSPNIRCGIEYGASLRATLRRFDVRAPLQEEMFCTTFRGSSLPASECNSPSELPACPEQP